MALLNNSLPETMNFVTTYGLKMGKFPGQHGSELTSGTVSRCPAGLRHFTTTTTGHTVEGLLGGGEGGGRGEGGVRRGRGAV